MRRRAGGAPVLTDTLPLDTVEDAERGVHPSGGLRVEFLPPLRVGRRRLRFRVLVPGGPRRGSGGRRRRPRRMGREHPRSARGRGCRVHLRKRHPGRQPDHSRRRPGAVRASVSPRRLLHAARHRLRPSALGGPARDRHAEPGRALHLEPHPGGRQDGRRGARRGRRIRRRTRVALAGAPQAALRPRDGRPRGRDGGASPRPDASRGARPGGPRAPGRPHGVRGDRGRQIPGRHRRRDPARRGRIAAVAGPAGRRNPLEPGRAGRRKRGAGLAHGGGVRSRARGRARGGSRRRVRGGRHAPGARRRAAGARPRHGSSLRPGPLAVSASG